MCRGFNFPLKYLGEKAGVLAGLYRDIVQCIHRDLTSRTEIVCVCVCVCVSVYVSETTGPIEAKFHVEPPWNRGRKFIQMVKAGVQVICCSSLLSTTGGGGGSGVFSRDFTINLSPQCMAIIRALKTEKLKAPLFPGPVGAGTTNDWCITTIQIATIYTTLPHSEIILGGTSVVVPYRYLFLLSVFILWFSYYVSDIF